MSENAYLNGHARPPVPTEAASEAAQPAGERFDTAEALLRLVLGGALVGGDELRIRLERWQRETLAASAEQSSSAAPPTLRDALVGMVFETESRMRRGFSMLFERFADEASLVSARLAPERRPLPRDPFWQRLDEELSLAMETVDRWAQRGRREDQQSRGIARQATVSLIDELLDYMAHNPEVRTLIEQQGAGMANSAVDDVRERTASADLWIERLAHNLLRRSGSGKQAAQAESTATPEPVTPAPVGQMPSETSGALAAPSAAAVPTSPLGAAGT